MKSILIRLTQAFVALLFFAVTGILAQAQTWPSRPINLVVGFAVGGSGNTIAPTRQP